MSQKPFHFIGKAPLSKSLLNRALIIKSWYPDFVIHGSSSCEDILIMEASVKKLFQFDLNLDFQAGYSSFSGSDDIGKAVIFKMKQGKETKHSNSGFAKQKKEFDCGLSKTAFRFLAVRLSREKGEFTLKADKSLFKRPLDDVSLFSQLSVSIEKTEQAYKIFSEGWKLQGDCLYIPSRRSSQWASAVLLNSWNLDRDLYFVFSQTAVSYSYFKMTLNFVRSLGLVVQQEGEEFFIPKRQSLKAREYRPEQDKSCLFALACFAVLKGKAVFLDWREESLQADHIFPDILKAMGVSIELKKNQLQQTAWNFSIEPHFNKGRNLSQKQRNLKQVDIIISKCAHLKALDLNLKNQPDLLPMLAVLCAKAEGLSVLRELSHLAFKESNRLQKIKELLEKCGIQVKIQKNNFLIYGQKEWKHKISPFVFDTEQDHRLAMAGALIASLGIPITLKGKSAVNKSFPEFYSLIHLR